MASVSFDVKQGQQMSLLVNTVKAGSSVWIDWGTGTRTEYTNQNAYISGSDRLKGTRIDGSAAGTRVTVYGDLSGVDVSGFGEYGTAMGLWDNQIQAMDLQRPRPEILPTDTGIPSSLSTCRITPLSKFSTSATPALRLLTSLTIRTLSCLRHIRIRSVMRRKA